MEHCVPLLRRRRMEDVEPQSSLSARSVSLFGRTSFRVGEFACQQLLQDTEVNGLRQMIVETRLLRAATVLLLPPTG